MPGFVEQFACGSFAQLRIQKLSCGLAGEFGENQPIFKNDLKTCVTLSAPSGQFSRSPM